MIELLLEPFSLGFMSRAFLGVSFIAILSGILGTFMVLRGLALMGEAIAHASFGGLAVAMFFGWPLHIGALLLGLGTACVVAFLGRSTRLKADSALAILLTGGFSFGVLGLCSQGSYGSDLTSLLLGSILAIHPSDLYWMIGAVLVAGLIIFVAFRHLVYVSFDPSGAAASGLPVTGLQLLLLSLIAVCIVIALQAIGVILVVALLITPAATAALVTRQIGKMIGLATLFGLIGSWIGLYLSYYISLPSGATIVAVLCIQFALGFVLQRILHRLRPLQDEAEGLT